MSVSEGKNVVLTGGLVVSTGGTASVGLRGNGVNDNDLTA